MENEKRQHKPYMLSLMEARYEVDVAFLEGDMQRLQKGLVNEEEASQRFQKVIASDSADSSVE